MRTTLIPLTALVLLAASGCGEKKEVTTASSTEQVKVIAPKPLSPGTICIYAAIATGTYAQAGLGVSVEPLAGQDAGLSAVASGGAQIAVATPVRLALARDSGAPVISVAMLTKQPLSWGAVDATGNSKAARAASERHAAASSGSPSAPSILVSSRESANSSGNLLRRFLQATGRACDSGPAKGLKGWTEAGGRLKLGRTGTSPAALQANLASGEKPWGWQPPAQWALLVSELDRTRQLRGPMAPDTIHTNEFLAGQGT